MVRVVLVLIVLIGSAMLAVAGQLQLAWMAPTENEDGTPLTDLSGYRIHYGTISQQYSTVVDVGLTTQAVLSGLTNATTYYLAAKAYDSSGNESVFTAEASATTGVGDMTPPTVQIISPVDGALVSRKSSVTIEVQAHDDSGIDRVQVYVNDVLLCADGSEPFRCTWRVPSSRGRTYRIRARASDTVGNQEDSDVVQVTSR